MTRIVVPTFIGIAVLTGCTATSPQHKEETAVTVAPLTTTGQKSSYNLGLLHIKALREELTQIDRQCNDLIQPDTSRDRFTMS